MAVAVVAVHSDSSSAWVASALAQGRPRLRHGARISSPASGRTRKAIAISAGTSSGAGAVAGRAAAARRARRAAVSRAGRHGIAGWSGTLEAGGLEHLLARRGQHVGHERLRGEAWLLLARWRSGTSVEALSLAGS